MGYVTALSGPRWGTRHGPFNFTPMGVKSTSPAHLHARPMGRTRRRVGELAKSRENTHPEHSAALFRGQDGGAVRAVRQGVHVPSRSTPPRWGSIRCRLAPRTYAPRGDARVVSLTKSRKITTRRILPLSPVVRDKTNINWGYLYLAPVGDGAGTTRGVPTRHPPFNSTRWG